MKNRLHRATAGLIAAAAVYACGRETTSEQPSAETVALVAALAATEAGTDASGAGVAGEEPFFVAGCNAGEVVAQVLDRLDGDGDGTLSAEELEPVVRELGGPQARRALMLRMYDADESGAIEAAELEAFESDVTARCEGRRRALLVRFDANGDGQLDAAEQEAAAEALRARFEQRHLRQRGDAGVIDSDADRDGPDWDRRRADAEARFDADGDGRSSPREVAAARDHLRGCVRGDHPMGDDGETPPAMDEPTTDEPTETAQ